MPNLTSVGITAGVPTSGSGTVSTLDNLPNLNLMGTSVRVRPAAPTVTTGAYVVNKCIGGVITVPNILPASLGAVLESISIFFRGSVQVVGFWVAVFDTAPTGTFTDNVVAAIASGDFAHLIGCYHLSVPCSMFGTTQGTSYNLDAIGKAFQGASTSLFVVVVPDGTTVAPGSTTDMTIELGVLWG